MASDNARYIVVSIPNEKRREGLFKYLDDPRYRRHVVERTNSKRVLTIGLFNRLQSKIDTYRFARVSLIEDAGDGEYTVVVPDARPMSDSYAEILRRIRY